MIGLILIEVFFTLDLILFVFETDFGYLLILDDPFPLEDAEHQLMLLCQILYLQGEIFEFLNKVFEVCALVFRAVVKLFYKLCVLVVHLGSTLAGGELQL